MTAATKKAPAAKETLENVSTAVATIPDAPTPLAVPDELLARLQAYEGGGLQDLSQADRVTPFIGLIQALSPQVDESKPGYIEEAKIGDLFNTVTGALYKNSEGGLRVIPVLFQKVWNQWIPRKSGGGFLGSYADPELKTVIFVPPTKDGDEPWDGPVDTVETANWYVLAEEKDGTWAPAIISMNSTKLKASRKWGTLTTIACNKFKTEALFVQIYTITSASETNEKGTFANYQIEATGFVTGETWDQAEQFRKAIQSGLVKIDMSKSTETTGGEDEAEEKRF